DPPAPPKDPWLPPPKEPAEPPPKEPDETADPPPIRPPPLTPEPALCELIVECPLAGMVGVAVLPRFTLPGPPFAVGRASGGDAINTGLPPPPCRSTSFEMWLSLPNVLRGTPSPAESLRNSKESRLLFSLEITSGF